MITSVEKEQQRIQEEAGFHDTWASTTNPEDIDVLQINTSLTAPEMRYITEKIEPINGKSLLDVGSGLGEASVYFSLKGANVTATDISPGMIDFVGKLASLYNTPVKTHLSTAENLDLEGKKFDIIYAGNLLHHVDIEETLIKIKRVMHQDSTFVSWDPLSYNPLINIYRKIATKVRTKDEHPLTRADIEMIHRHFGEVRLRFFWLTTLIIFVIMAIVQWRNPNKIRYWKKVVEEEKKWSWLYNPLKKIDDFLINNLPWVGWFCWNVVVEAKRPIKIDNSLK